MRFQSKFNVKLYTLLLIMIRYDTQRYENDTKNKNVKKGSELQIKFCHVLIF
jgi:hypothetical protein